MHHKHMYDLCMNHMHRYVLVQTTDQQMFDGIVEHVDENNLYLAVPIGGEMEREEERGDERLIGGAGFGFPGYGFPGYGFPGYGFPGHWHPYHPWPRRRFRRLVLPLAALTALTLLPYY